ncbi:MAG: hypothetical protein QNJ72_20720 [Pleurocapsa sp. MO_226.B13]|nr:hypothetical protein [Pleurocapsa sp. MO_226.B13]
MESLDRSKEKELKDKRLLNRLRLATTRVKDVERERIWAIASAHAEGLSIRTIAKVTGLSSSRVHQLLHTDEADRIPDWLNDLSASNSRMDTESDGQQKRSLSELQQELADEGEVLRWCIEWLEKLALGEKVVVNLRASIDPRTAYVGIDRSWVLRVLKRVAANLDQLSGNLFPTEESEVESNPIIEGVKLRHRLAEPEPELSSLTHREQRAILREKMGLPPM